MWLILFFKDGGDGMVAHLLLTTSGNSENGPRPNCTYRNGGDLGVSVVLILVMINH